MWYTYFSRFGSNNMTRRSLIIVDITFEFLLN